jgi:hypothetical protein
MLAAAAAWLVQLMPACGPIVTPVAPVNPVPVMVTLVPPAVGPLLGLIDVTVGAGTTT